MSELVHVFAPREWAIIVAAGMLSGIAGALVWVYFHSRWWREAVTNPEGRVAAGDLQKHGSWILACALVVAIAVAKLGYERDAGGELIGLVVALLSYSGTLQVNKRLAMRDVATASKPDAPKFDVKADNVSIGPNGATAAGANGATGQPAQPAPTE